LLSALLAALLQACGGRNRTRVPHTPGYAQPLGDAVAALDLNRLAALLN